MIFVCPNPECGTPWRPPTVDGSCPACGEALEPEPRERKDARPVEGERKRTDRFG